MQNSANTTATWEPEPNITASVDTPIAIAKIVMGKWLRKIDQTDKEVITAKIKGTAKVSLETQDVLDDTEIIVSILDASNNSELTTTETRPKVKIENNKGTSSEITVADDWVNKELLISVISDNNSILEETYTGTKKIKISCCEHAIIKGESGDLIKEINIRLAGFGEAGCPLPQNKFDDRTEMAVKQFQRDYMKVTPTGIVCKHFLEKLDEFCTDYYIKFETDTNLNIKCPCVTTTSTTGQEHKCIDGFGKGRASLNSPSKSGPENPGVHRSLLWAVAAMKFYIDKVEITDNMEILNFSSGYRCIADNIRSGRNSTNHMGNAVDIQFSGSGTPATRADKMKELCAIYSGAHIRWTSAKNKFCMEPSIASYKTETQIEIDDPNNPGKKVSTTKIDYEDITSTWLHIDCREFDKDDYKKDEFYCKTEDILKGISFIIGKLVETADSEKYKDIKNCSYEAVEKEKREREETLWLGMIQTAYQLEFSSANIDADKKWNAKFESIPLKANINITKPRIQEIVTILAENNTQYKIQPRGHSDTGWIAKTYIKQICKYEKDV